MTEEKPKERTVKEFLVRLIEVDVKRNDQADIKCGGPLYLGFTFPISAEEKQGKAERLMQEILNKYGVPHIRLHVSPTTTYSKRVWTWEEIEECVRRDGPDMSRWT